MLLLATDLDGTLLGGPNEEKEILYNILNDHPGIKLVFVTGRGLESVLPLFQDSRVPIPDYIICDVGATVVDGHTLEPVEPIQSEISMKWPGFALVSQHFHSLPFLVPQEVPMQRRCSYYLDERIDLQLLKQKAAELNLEITVSAGKYIDVLPAGVHKGSTLSLLMKMLQVPHVEVLVAGDTLNDLSLFQTGYRGVVVGGAEQKLKEATADHDFVYHAQSKGAGGILEAFRVFYDLG